MKVLLFTKYTRLGASSRLRTYQYLPYYETTGVRYKICPLFDDSYLHSIYSKMPVNKFRVLKNYLGRFLQLLLVWKYDVIVIEKELFPYLPATVEKVLSLLGVKYIVDYDDAIFHNYDEHPNKFIRAILKGKIAQVMKHAKLVVAGNAYLMDYAVQAGAKGIRIIPTVIDTSKYFIKSNFSSNKTLAIGWIGSPSTLQYLHLIKPVLEELRTKYPIKLIVIGGKSGIGMEGFEEIIDWSEDSEIELIQSFDIGVMPLKNDLWELGKCGYKLIQYMGCGVPVIGSPVGANTNIILEGKNGFMSSNLYEWKIAFQKLLEDEELRRQMGIYGRMLVEEKYSLRMAQKQWLGILNEVTYS